MATATTTTTPPTIAWAISPLQMPTPSTSKAVHKLWNPALSSLSPEDRVLFYRYGLGPRRNVDTPIIHHAFEYHARTQPDVVAVEHTTDGQSLTFKQLDIQANRLAHRLRAQGIQPGKRVCILARRSVHLVAAILAVLKSGGQYVPLDALTIPDSTLSYVLNDAKPSIVLAMSEFVHRVSSGTVPTIDLEAAIHADELANADGSKPVDTTTPSSGAYIIYTSGTTGVPKGVDVRHRGVTNVISGTPGNVGMKPGLRVGQFLNVAFDMGAWEILGSLYNGCTLCIRGNTKRDWITLMKTVHIVIATPSILTLHDPADYPNIQNVIVGDADASLQANPARKAPLADKWARFTNFSNCCGPTEISICNTVQPHTPGYPLSIGKPIPNTNVYVLSRDPTCTKPVPIGETGCMWVGGTGVSNGYLNLLDKTAERYRPDPFLGGSAMMFNTGDLGRWRSDGQLDHLGRADDQVKVKGFRVELDGVSAAMRTHEPVHSAVALLVGTELWGFITPSTVDLSQVRDATAAVQPYHAVPTQYLALDEFPMTKNGKVDKRALVVYALDENSTDAKRFSAPSRSGSTSPS
ncbi:Nonribosomal peptide synthetase 12 [Mycena indigotica]|uniref:Nonribosomal peptide synthetase 12 n=1 Tax=Mycena indigotica TaxID=2126181 RepID=A0A8H6SWM1_9AGAR|nr:Nonribosomal peptide synthetase 12 [Mycena indigotica]KAF7306480.1 Nonribosomal peptide synthetase 12 [Mycena indigotica]